MNTTEQGSPVETTVAEERYVWELTSALSGMPAARRSAIVGDVRAHIAAATADGHPVGSVLATLGSPADVADDAGAHAGFEPAGARRMYGFDVAMLVVCLVAQVSSLPAMIRYLTTVPGGQGALVTLLPVVGAALVAFSPLRRRALMRFIVVIAATAIELAAVILASLDLVQDPVAQGIVQLPFVQPAIDLASYLGVGLGVLILMGWTGVGLNAWMHRPRGRMPGLLIRLIAGVALVIWALTGLVSVSGTIIQNLGASSSIPAQDIWSLLSFAVLTVLVIGFFTGRRPWYLFLALYGLVLMIIATTSNAQFADLQASFAAVYVTFGMAGWTALSPRLVGARSQAANVD
jgi:uncharacterized membrane protein